MNDDALNDSTNWPISPDNEATLDAAIFSASIVTATVSNVSDIAPDAHFLSSGLKLDTALFSKGGINNIADKYIIDTTPYPDAPGAEYPDAAVQDDGSIDSNSPYSARNHKFPPYSTNTIENQKRKGNKIDDKVTIDNPSWPQRTQSWYPQCFRPRCWLHQLLSPIFI